MFAIITFRDTGPLKTWQSIRAANIHNARTKPLAHAMPDAPMPTHLIGRGDLEQDVKRLLRGAKLDPDRLRKNGVIAYEAILSASPAFFEQGTPEERSKRLADWTAAQVEWATERYKSFRIASMVLHVDEKTPHIHLVVLPLEVKPDARCTDKNAMRWKLVGRTVSGPGRFDEAQDAYSAAMASFGLKRGVKGSKRKHEPVPIYLKRLAEKESQVDQTKRQLELDLAGVAADRDQNGRDRIALEAGFAELARAAAAARVERDRLAAETAALEQARVDHAAQVAAHARAEDERRRALEWDRHAMQADAAAERRRLAEDRAALEAERVSHAARAAENERRLAAERDAVRGHLSLLATMEDELQHDLEEQRAETAAVKRAMEAAAYLRQEAEADRAAAATERAAVREMGDHLNAHRDRLLPTLKAAHAFRQQVAALKGQPLTPVASSTRAAVDALARSSAAITPPSHEVRPGVLAQYAHIRRQGERIRA
jgi:hypothetical protein